MDVVVDNHLQNVEQNIEINNKPPAFSKPRPPPASPMRKTNNVRTPRRVIGSSGRGLPSLDGSSNRMRTI